MSVPDARSDIVLIIGLCTFTIIDLLISVQAEEETILLYLVVSVSAGG